MILFELLPMKSNLQQNTGATLLEILACRQQRWTEKIASSRKPGTRGEEPQQGCAFRFLWSGPTLFFLLQPAENEGILNAAFPYRRLLEMTKGESPCFK